MSHQDCIILPECIAIKPWPVGDRSIERTHMDKVKVVFRMHPRLFHIIDLEFEVGWDKVRLDRGQIRPDDLRGGIFICEVSVPFVSRHTREITKEIV